MAGNLSRANELNTGKGLLVTITTVIGMLFLIAPMIVLVVYSFNASRTVTMWEGFSLKWYSAALSDSSLWSSIKNSLVIAFVNTLASTILGTMAALALGKYKFRSRQVFVNILYVPIILPEIIFGISLLVIFLLMNIPLGLLSIILAHVTFSLPFVALVVLSKVNSIDKALEEASMDLGANRWLTYRKVILPQIAPGIISGALFAFTMSIDDFVITFFTAGTGVSTLPLKIYSLIKMGITPAINAISSILIFLTISAILLIGLLQKENVSKRLVRMIGIPAGSALLLVFLYITIIAKDQEELYISNYSDYLSAEVIRDFEQKYNIKVHLDYYNDLEEMLAKLQMKAMVSDIVVPTDFMVQILIKQNLLSKINFDNIPNFRNIDPRFKGLDFDPADEYHVPYTTGCSGLSYNSDYVKDSIRSWKELWDPKYKGKLLLTDDMREVLNIGFRINGFRMKNRNKDELKKALDTLISLKKQLKKFESNLINDFLTTGEVYIAQNWSGGSARLSLANPKFKFCVPKEGAFYFMDNFCIPSTARNKKNAELFINYLLDPKVAAKNMTGILYSMPNLYASKYLKENIRKNLELSDELMKRIEPFPDIGDYNIELEKAWTRLKSN